MEGHEATTSSDKTENRELTPEEKVERAKEMLEEKRKQKEQEEKEVSICYHLFYIVNRYFHNNLKYCCG